MVALFVTVVVNTSYASVPTAAVILSFIATIFHYVIHKREATYQPF